MRHVPLVLLLAAAPAFAEDLGLKVPPGFKVTLWADHKLANDIYTMALDEQGRVVVSGPGYVRRLEDTDGDGKADKATDIAHTKTGAMGLLFLFDPDHRDKFDLYTAADGAVVSHYALPDQDLYRADRDVIKPFPFSEHGGHALKMGPDGLLYAIAGNDTKFGEMDLRATPGPTAPEGGGLLRLGYGSRRASIPGGGGAVRFSSVLRLTPDVIAHGFRNPYDFDFTPYGDIVTYDSDTERDHLLPWYSPTRVYHVLPGAHHGWRLPGYMQSLARRDYYPDTVEVLADMGRGSPTGVCCYRHTQFPKHYRGGVFLLDWTFGRVHYLPLIPEGSSYQKAVPEPFLQATGTNGFAPTAARVAPDGSLFISVGGRGTRGGVYRVEYRPNGEEPVIPPARADEALYEVLDASQPNEAWSEAHWAPLARDIDAQWFEAIAQSNEQSPERRIRAIEVLVKQNHGLPFGVARLLTKASSPLVRARVAWAVSFGKASTDLVILWVMAEDPHPRVRAAALEGLAGRLKSDFRPDAGQERVLKKCLGDEDGRVRLAAANVVSKIAAQPMSPVELLVWKRDEDRLWRDAGPREIVGLTVAYAASGNRPLLANADLVAPAWAAFGQAKTSAERIDALRALALAAGDWNLASPGVELHAAYSLNFRSPKERGYFRLVFREKEGQLLDRLPSASELEKVELSRLLAMAESDNPRAVTSVLSLITKDTDPTSDFHYLTVLSRLTASRTKEQTNQVADALLGMEAKLRGRHLRVKQSWAARLGELVGELLKLHPGLDKLLAAHPDLAKPGHVVIAARLIGEPRTEAARRFLAAVKDDEDFPLSAELIDLVAGLPAGEVRPVLRARWSDRSAREAIVKQLAPKPDPIDRGRFLEVLETASGDSLKAALDALAALPRDDSPKNLVPVLARLRQAFSDPKEGPARKQLLALANRQTGQAFAITEGKTDPPALAAAYAPVFAWFEKAHPAEAKRLTTTGEDEEAIRKLLPRVKWEAGDAERGRKLYRDRGCQACHGGSARIAPDLAGVSRRFSRDDLLTAVLNPSRDVAPAYRVTNVDTKDGKRLSGIVVFESADGLILQTEAAETRRIATGDIEARTPSPKSLMPDGLLTGLKPEDLANLFAFLAKQ